jgi:spore germination cell wall hydrolase CwlJ-like protein
MSRKVDIASAIAVALTLGLTLFSADGSGAVAQSRTPKPVAAPANPQIAGAPDNLLPETYPAPSPAAAADVREEQLPPPAREADATLTLAEMVSEQTSSEEPSRELECLAGAIYFEAKSETLEGQLAVGRVIVNRARSGRFPASYCGVVFQRSQFSFIRGNAMPAINRASRDWKQALAIAQIAHEGTWTSAAEGALFFHAARVSPNWRLTRIARVDSHIFYR